MTYEKTNFFRHISQEKNPMISRLYNYNTMYLKKKQENSKIKIFIDI